MITSPNMLITKMSQSFETTSICSVW